MPRILALMFLLFAGCVIGDVAPSPAPVPPDEPPPPLATATLTGLVRDYFTQDPVPAATLETVGFERELVALSDADGAYAFQPVPIASAFFLRIGRDAEYRTTLDEVWLDGETVADQWVVARGDAERQYATVGLPMRDDRATVLIDLTGPTNAPVEGLALAEITLLDPAGIIVAPGYFIGALGDVDPELAVSRAFLGRARAAFLDVPEGVHTLHVDCKRCDPRIVVDRAVVARAATVTLTSVDLAGAPALVADFARVRQILQRGVDGGAGCANCHSAGGPSDLELDLPADELYALLQTRPGLVDLASPSASLLLTKPLYEVPANHPNATWLDPSHREYQAIQSWIAAGASR